MSSLVELQKNLQDKVSEKIKASFMDLIPPEMFDTLVESAMDDFINGTKWRRDNVRSQYYDSHTNETVRVPYNPIYDPDTLPGMIMKAVQDKGKEKLLAIIDGPDFQQVWEGSQAAASKAIKDMIAANAEMFVATLFGGLVNSSVRAVGQKMRETTNGQFYFG